MYIVDDEPMIRRLLKRAFDHDGLQARAFEDGRRFLDAIGTLDPGVVLLDLRMPEIDGIDVLKAMGPKTRIYPVLMLSSHGDVSTAVQAIHAGAIDFIEKPFSVPLLIDRVRRLGEQIQLWRQQRSDLEAAEARISHLSQREREVGKELASGLSNKEIARKLELSPRTVEAHRARIMKKLDVSSLAEVVRIFVSSGI